MRASLRRMSETNAIPEWLEGAAPELRNAVRPYLKTLDGTLGIVLESAEADEVIATIEIDDRHKQPFGLVHGGLYAVIAESAASVGGAITAIPSGGAAVGLSNNTAFLRPFIGDGKLTSTARRIHGGRTTQLWDVEHVGPDGKLCATSRVTIALRPGDAGQPKPASS